MLEKTKDSKRDKDGNNTDRIVIGEMSNETNISRVLAFKDEELGYKDYKHILFSYLGSLI